MFRNMKKKKKKNFQLEKKLQYNLFLAAQVFFFPLQLYISKSTNIFEKKFTYVGRSQKIELIFRISKKLGVKSRNETVTKTQKSPFVL